MALRTGVDPISTCIDNAAATPVASRSIHIIKFTLSKTTIAFGPSAKSRNPDSFIIVVPLSKLTQIEFIVSPSGFLMRQTFWVLDHQSTYLPSKITLFLMVETLHNRDLVRLSRLAQYKPVLVALAGPDNGPP